MNDIVIVSAVRTPFGSFGGSLKAIKAVDLGAMAIKEALTRAGIEGSQVDEVIMGMVVPAGTGQIPGRQASILGGIPADVPVITINKVCGSALKAVTLGTQIIKAGDAEIIVAGGMESMSNVPYVSYDTRWGSKMGNVTMKDALVHDGLWCPVNDVHIAVIASEVAEEFEISRESQDKWAYRSQTRWQMAEEAGKFSDERMPIEIKTRKGPVVFDKDESPRPETTLEKLSTLPPVFTKKGTITAGNAPGMNDGASAVVIMTRKKAEELGIKPLASITDYAQASRDAKYIASVPGLAIQKLLQKRNMSIENVDLIEINEAFAAVPLVSCKILDINEKTMDEKVNVNGSAVAVGHPIGASGARILMTLIYELKRQNKKTGIAAICSGMAQGLIEVE
ncbi:MAG: acetyl-CoA C-acyltransferase [Ignavibacteriae bacterium HGW-Ignavibacteriae-4]|nr:MAG: acetyl-CoA C-acyltransferase [Ignavibacteriae bacterium HGW-Ignavibacteriae-4]